MTTIDDQCPEVHQEPSVKMLNQDDAEKMASLYKVLSDPTRLRLLSLLIHQEMCVGDIALSLKMEQSAISHQLRQLRQQRIVKMRKQGKHALYTLVDEHILNLFQQSLTHVKEQ